MKHLFIFLILGFGSAVFATSKEDLDQASKNFWSWAVYISNSKKTVTYLIREHPGGETETSIDLYDEQVEVLLKHKKTKHIAKEFYYIDCGNSKSTLKLLKTLKIPVATYFRKSVEAWNSRSKSKL